MKSLELGSHVYNSLTKRQYEALEFIADFLGGHGYSPSFEEIGNGLGLSSLATVHKRVFALKAKGYIEHDPFRSRSIMLSRKWKVRRGSKACPLCGHRGETREQRAAPTIRLVEAASC